ASPGFRSAEAGSVHHQSHLNMQGQKPAPVPGFPPSLVFLDPRSAKNPLPLHSLSCLLILTYIVRPNLRCLRRRMKLAAYLAVLLFVGVNALAFMHARAMTHFA